VLFLVEGIILVILGLAAVVIPPIATLAVEILYGWLFLAEVDRCQAVMAAG
jgi:uncharacterized membrane protein HdeD (DUF308 family)